MKRRLVALAVATCGIGLVAACDGPADNPPGAQAGTGGVLTIGAAQGIKVLNPVTKSNAWEQALFSLMWNSLVKTGQDLKTQPDLATAWSSSADLRTWTFTLRQGVTFSNGKPLTPADVVSTIEYYRKPDTVTQLKNNVAPIVSVKASGADDVVFELTAPNALFPTSIELVKIVDTASMSTMESQPAVTGPFKVKEFVADDHLTLERNPKFFGQAAKLDGVKLVKTADASAAVTALQAGDLDALWSVPLSQVSSIQGNPRLRLSRPAVIGQYVSWEVDTTAPPFNNPKARQALAYAIDARAILKAAYFDQGVVSTTNDPLTTNNPNYAGSLTDYTYNLDKARALFAAAGITEGSTLTWWGVAGQYPEWNISAQILQESLKKIGITLKIENTDIASWPAKFYPAGKQFPGMIVPNFQSFQPNAADLLLFVLSGRCECNWNNKQVDDLYNRALGTADPQGQKAVWGQVQELVNKEAPIFVPLQFATLTATKNTVAGLWVDGAGNPHVEDAGFVAGQ
ncbi:ABC transporter substrate-binding protein [Actinocrispum wychmicini]|nr:ABC transporter substrate-binding protein [Actinocrispum wychmicini]